jgi:hypothetical protein
VIEEQGRGRDPAPCNAELTGVSADLPYELQSKLFEQLATLGVAGAGLVITLKGSILRDASALIWMGAIEFGAASLIALAAQIGLIEGLLSRRLSRRPYPADDDLGGGVDRDGRRHVGDERLPRGQSFAG